MTPTTPARVSVSVWGERRGETAIPGLLRVLIGGESAGGADRQNGRWVACWYSGMSPSGAMRDAMSEHDTAEDAVRAVIRAPWSRRLGARTASVVEWSPKAIRLAARPS